MNFLNLKSGMINICLLNYFKNNQQNQPSISASYIPNSSSSNNLFITNTNNLSAPSTPVQSSQIEAETKELIFSAPSPNQSNQLSVTGNSTNNTKISPNSNSNPAAISNGPIITHTASASNLVEFFCSIAESKTVS
jgi:hypothetical protein